MTLEDYEDALKSFIHDDDKLVTYKWLSKEFEIHVNVAKDILKQYWEKHKDSEKIVATFLLVGQLKDKSIRVEVVKETNLNVAKNKFIKVDCEHLYSLQKSLHDIELLTFAGDGDLRFSAIKCNEEYIRSNDEIEGLRYIGNVRKEEIKPNNSSNKVLEKQLSKETEFSKEKIQSVKIVRDPIKEKSKVEERSQVEGKSKVEEKNKVEQKEKLESKSESKSITVEKKVSPTNKSTNLKSMNKVTKKPIQSKQSGFNNLFGKVSNKSQETNKSNNEVHSVEKQKHLIATTKKEETKESKEKIDLVKDQKKEMGTPKREKENQNCESKEKTKNISKISNNSNNKPKSKNKEDPRGKKRNRSEEKNSSSKRKRIVVMDSSEDEEDKSNDDEEEELMEVELEPPKISRKRSPSPPAEKCENGKRMVRKTVDKTFKDEDGYLVTKSVHVYEVASDSEEPENVKKEESKKPKPVENKARKQTSLMSFFKKS